MFCLASGAKYVKPERFCPYRPNENFIKGGKLKRHVKRRHPEELDNFKETNYPFLLIRTLGYCSKTNPMCPKANKHMVAVKKGAYGGDIVHCANCNGSYSTKYFQKHKRSCFGLPIEKKPATKTHAMLINRDITDFFQRDPQQLQFCGRPSWRYLLWGCHPHSDWKGVIWQREIKSRRDRRGKKMCEEHNADCMKTIPQFSRIEGGKCELIDMFDRSNWSALVQAINQLTRPQVKNTTQRHLNMDWKIQFTIHVC